MEKKSWLSKPENVTGFVVAGIMLFGIAWGAIHLLPFLILATTNIIYEGFLLAVLGAMIFAALSPAVHNIVYYAWKSFTRKLTGMVIDMDPISVVETALKKMQSRLDDAITNKNEVAGQLKALDEKIAVNASRAELDMRKAQLAQQKGDERGRTLMALEAQQLTNSNKNLGETRIKIAMMSSVLNEMTSAVDFNIKKTRSELEIKKEERKAIMSAHKAMQSGWKVLGTSEEKEMFDRAMESMSDTANRQLAEIDQIMDASSGMIKGVDLEKGILQDDALKALKNWQADTDSALLGTTKTVLIQRAVDPLGTIDVTPRQATKQNRFNDLLK